MSTKRVFRYILGISTITVVYLLVYDYPLKNNVLLQTKSTLLYDENKCNCPRVGSANTEPDLMNLCSKWSATRGKNQNVISYTIFGDHRNKKKEMYYRQIEDRIQEANNYYSGWIVRMYHNVSERDEFTNRLICEMYCKYPNFDPCNVNFIPIPTNWTWSSQHNYNANNIFSNIAQLYSPFRNYIPAFLEKTINMTTVKKVTNTKSSKNTEKRKSFAEILIAKLWRFLPLADSYVANFLSRDLDSFILPREVSAVNQWLKNSTALIHAMRDHPSHNGVILAGMWGGARWRDEEKMSNFLKEMTKSPQRNVWDFDQILLRRIIWPEVLDQILVHDSYYCSNFLMKARTKTQPYPTKRRGHLFVSWGPYRSSSELDGIVPCPRDCRPPEHPDWNYC